MFTRKFFKRFRWGNEYPSDCPKSDVKEVAKMVVYRFVDNNPPIEDDFLPYSKLHPHRYTCCNSWGISFFKSEDIMKKKQLANNNFKNKLIAKGILESHDGKIKVSNSGHINLWMYDRNDIHKKFKVLP